MLDLFPFYIALIVFIMLLIILARRIHVAYPIVLVFGGLMTSLIPALPIVRIEPKLIFLVFMPPLLYEATWQTSWKEFWKSRYIIGSFAFLIVLLSSLVVAWVASNFIPGFSLALGFLLGGIVAPPDAVSASAIMQSAKVPRTLKAAVEGESLINDASSLVVFRFALMAVGSGQFVFTQAAADLFWVILVGIAIGLIIAGVFFLLHRWLPTDENIDLVFTMVAPYVMYIIAESLEASGVLAVVSGGLLLARFPQQMMSSGSRLRTQNVWSALGFVLNGLVFVLIGLELPSIINSLDGVDIKEAVGYGVLITGVLIITRLFSAYGAYALTVWAGRVDPSASFSGNWKLPLVFGWSGMRGVVSLAAALSVPVTITGTDNPFPHRNLILFITFIVILLTLIVQGLTLPVLIKRMRLTHPKHHLLHKNEAKIISRNLAERSLQYMQEHYAKELESKSILQWIIQKWQDRKTLVENEDLDMATRKIYLEILDKQREWLHEFNKDPKTDEAIIRSQLLSLDLEEERLKLF